MWTKGDNYKIILFYRYVKIDDVSLLISQLREKCERAGLLGRILVSEEGINGTLAGSLPDVSDFVSFMNHDSRFSHVDWKETLGKGDYLPFLGLSIRQVDEIISCGEKKQFINSNIEYNNETFGGINGTGQHLTPAEFHQAMNTNQEKVLLLDIRNEFEYDIGHFENALNIGTFTYAETFKALDEVFQKQQQEPQTASVAMDNVEEAVKPPQDTKILMYCTGGIRCEKASAYLRAMGHDNVYQLQGGIHRYLEAYPEGGKFLGKNFVFDSRVSVGPTTVTNQQQQQQFVHADVAETITDADKTKNNSTSSEGDTEDEAENHSNCLSSHTVVGKCIDCEIPYDEYSGYIVCTVCRMPVLVCPSCQTANPHPEEYYCHRHRDLKNIYFTVLTTYSCDELLQQKEALKKCLDDCLVLSATSKGQKQIKRIEVDTNKIDGQILPEMKTTSRNRRRTLRRQIARIEERLKELYATQSALVKDLLVQQVNDLNINDQVRNPKNKGGWGFWRA